MTTLYHFIITLVLSIGTLSAMDRPKLDPGFDIPPHVQKILHVFHAIHQKDEQMIQPEYYSDDDLHRSFTLFFDPTWPVTKDIPGSVDGLRGHYDKVRKVIAEPYWAHLTCLELIQDFNVEDYISSRDLMLGKLITLHDAVTGEPIIREDSTKIIQDLGFFKKHNKLSPWDSGCLHHRETIGLDKNLPIVIERLLFLMALADETSFLCGVMNTHMGEYLEHCNHQRGEITYENPMDGPLFVEDLYDKLVFLTITRDKMHWGFLYINWFIDHYDVFKGQ
jgi:hypothetical protein